MKTLIEILLGLIACYCAFSWFVMVRHAYSERPLFNNEYRAYNQQACLIGICGILALGFLGLMMK